MIRSLFGSFCLSVAMAVQLAAAPPQAGLLGDWKFDEAQGDLAGDRSGHGNSAILVGAEWAKGPLGAALHLPGKNGYVTVPELAGLDGRDELTVEAWALWESAGRYPNILTGGQWSPGGFMFFVSDRSCSFRMGRPGPRPGQPAGAWQEISAPLVGRIEFGKWYHLAATFKRPLITTYVNGKKAGSARWDYPVGYRGDLELGRWGGQTCHRGLIGEVQIFNRALAADEIHAGYAAEASRHIAGGPVTYTVVPAVAQVAARLENRLARLEIDVRGRCTALVEKRTGRNLLAKPWPLASMKVERRTLSPRLCSYAGGKLQLEFDAKHRATLAAAVKDRYIVFSVAAATGPDIDGLTFVSLAVEPGVQASSTSGAVMGDTWGACLREMNLETQVTLAGGAPVMLSAACIPQYGLTGAKAGLVVAPSGELRAALQDMVRSEGLPCSSLGGPGALEAEGIRGSYLFAHPSERDVERWIDLAKRGGFTHLHDDYWYKSLGHYEPSPALFPSGLEGIKTMVRKIHAAGLKAGMHTLTGCIDTRDAWVTPVPDKRLAVDASYRLAADVDAKSDSVLTADKPQAHDVIWSYAGRGNALRIGEEIVLYSAISATEPYGFLKCKRGAFGTRPAAHRKGETVDHLRQIYLAFYPDDRSTLVGEVAGAIARVFNECEFDQIYMDGSEGMGSTHAIQTMRDAIYRRLKRPAVVEASCWDHWSWYYHSRIGAWDHPKWGLKPFTDLHCASIANYREGALLQAQLGWWVVLGPSPMSRAETPDEMEYFCAKALAFDAPSSTQGVGSLDSPWNARTKEYLTMAGWYERLRLANYFSESVRKQLREPGADFHLQRDGDGQWQLLPADYLAHKVTGLENGSSRWTVANRFQEQPLGMRLEALYSVLPYDSPQSPVVADCDGVDRFTTRRAAPGVTHSLARSSDQVKIGPASLCFKAANRNPSRKGAWAQAGIPFDPYLSIKPCDALGVWVHGDGKGEVLNLQLTSPREYMQAYGEHYVRIDFTGWRYFELPLRERDADRWHHYQWPYSGIGPIYMTSVNLDHVNQLNLYLNDLPANDTATVYLGPIKALRTRGAQLVNPTVELNGQKLALPTTLASGDYVELDAAGDCRVYDARGTLRERLDLAGPRPRLRPGENRVGLACEPPRGLSARAELTLIAFGPPLENRVPASQVRRELLRDDYDAPRIVTRLDGRQDAWQVVCRKGAARVPFGVELDVEHVKAAKPAGMLRHPTITVGAVRLVFPVELGQGDQLVFDGRRCRVHRKARPEPEWIEPQGGPATLAPGVNRVQLSFASDPPSEFRAAVSLVRYYP